jgi:SAM-dependent methyltransferase
MPDSRPPKICDYEGSNYRTDFWEGRGRDYEDRIERIALRRLLPDGGKRALEIGAGFGRLSDEFDQFDQVVVMDYSFSQLQYAQEHHGVSDHFIYVAADAYQLPFKAGAFDAATMIRVIHHMADVPTVLHQVRRVLNPNARFVLEHANKQNLKAMARYALRKQDWSPYARDPVEFVELNFDFHPAYILKALQNAGFLPKKRLPVSFFRINALKQTVPTSLLVGLDSLLQYTGILFTPSVFVQAFASNQGEDNLDAETIFVCPADGGDLTRKGDVMTCRECGLRYAIRDGIYDFKAPLE